MTEQEQSGKPTKQSETSNQIDTESDALVTADAQIDLSLEFIIRAWPDLSGPIRTHILRFDEFHHARV